MPALLLLLLACAPEAAETTEPPVTESATPPPIATLTDAERTAMTGVSWHEGCPVALDDLRVVRFAHKTDAGGEATGELIVHAEVAEAVLTVMQALHAADFPLAGVRPVRHYAGDDDKSMAADNTSGFNCRRVSGSSRWSEHSYGRAIDVNPLRNPWVRGSAVAPPAGRDWVTRDGRPGMIMPDGPVVKAFASIGWKWGGNWTNSKDYQHFSESGR
jgi:poly-gamma-glutamate synthesis protein (capsule biosynthesis protein)